MRELTKNQMSAQERKASTAMFAAIIEHLGGQRATARLLGVSQTALYKRLTAENGPHPDWIAVLLESCAGLKPRPSRRVLRPDLKRRSTGKKDGEVRSAKSRKAA